MTYKHLHALAAAGKGSFRTRFVHDTNDRKKRCFALFATAYIVAISSNACRRNALGLRVASDPPPPGADSALCRLAE